VVPSLQRPSAFHELTGQSSKSGLFSDPKPHYLPRPLSLQEDQLVQQGCAGPTITVASQLRRIQTEQK